MPLEVFTQGNFVADFFQQMLNFTDKKQQNHVLCHHLGDLGVMHRVHLWLD